MAFFSQNALFSMLRLLGLTSALLAIVFVINNFLIFGVDAPGLINTLRLGDVLGVAQPKQGYNIALVLLGIVQTAVVGLAVSYVVWHCRKTSDLRRDANWMDSTSAYIVRLAFWAVLLVGLADSVLSFLRVEGFHTVLFGDAGGAAIALPSQRGFFVHIPLILLAGLIALGVFTLIGISLVRCFGF